MSSPYRNKRVLVFAFVFFILPVAGAVVTVENLKRFWRRVFHSFHSRDCSRLDLVSSTLRETDCYSWPDTDVVTLSWMRPSRGRSRKPRVLCLENEAGSRHGCSFCVVSRRSLGPAVSSAVKGAVELSGRKTNGRCFF